MTNPDQLQVVASLKRGGFTKSGTIDEVLKAIEDILPVQQIFFVLPHPDGKGYSLREAGKLVLDIQASADVEAVVPQEVLTASPTPPAPPTPISAPQPLYGQVVTNPIATPTPQVIPPSNEPSVVLTGNLLGIGPIKSQRTIAIERGLEPPRPVAPPPKARKRKAKVKE